MRSLWEIFFAMVKLRAELRQEKQKNLCQGTDHFLFRQCLDAAQDYGAQCSCVQWPIIYNSDRVKTIKMKGSD